MNQHYSKRDPIKLLKRRLSTQLNNVAFRRNAAPTTDSDQGLIDLIYHKKMIQTFYPASFLKTCTSSGHPN